MNIIEITDIDGDELAPYRDLTDVALRSRAEPAAGIYMAESAKVIRRAIAAGHTPISIITEHKWLSTFVDDVADIVEGTIFVGTPELLESVTGFHVHRGAIAAMRRPPLASVTELIAGARRVIILDGIADHTNVGAAFRAVAGLGADAILITEECADPFYRRSVRVSMGTVLQVPWTRMPAWTVTRKLLHDAGFEIAAFALTDDAVPLDDYVTRVPEKLAIVLGSEGYGLGPDALEAADAVVKIPMSHGVDSLNVAAACAVATWALRPGVAPQVSSANQS